MPSDRTAGLRLRPLRPDDEVPGTFPVADMAGEIIARAAGVDRVLMIRNEANAGSRAAIEACGGKLECLTTIAAQQA